MLTGIRFPNKINAEELDKYLESGWRPMGQGIYTTNFLRPDDGKVYSTLSARLPLESYSFGKRMRKLLKKNRAKFSVIVRKAQLTEEITRVAQAYHKQFPDRGGSEIEFHLENHRGEKVFNTLQVLVYKGKRLVAFSLIDVGKISLYSKIGLYDPALAKDSLGIYTMLEEIQFALDQGMAYYYPGYVGVGLSTFDYKHRIGALEYYEIQSGQWRAYAHLEECKTPIHQMKTALKALYDEVKTQNILSGLFVYPSFDIKLSLPESLPYLDNPFVLLTDAKTTTAFNPYVTVFNPIEGLYEIQQILLVGGRLVPEFIQKAQTWQDLQMTLVCTRPLFQSANLIETADYLKKL
ncbi:MAG: hypothetical protein DHS20C18_21990 [Saprospiraceae bacterium]|nr:MAG: hypothetical protein DHS20C18_21990 [Saprospiraceae bacterium]